MAEPGSQREPRWQVGVSLAVLALALGLGAGARTISDFAGYGGVAPNFLPWVVAGLLGLCSLWLLKEALQGGFREMGDDDGAPRGHWLGFAWVSAGLLLNAWLITSLGFILSCALCYVLAIRGFRSAEGRQDLRPRIWLQDALVGMAISAPVFWGFTQLLAINLPGLSNTGWI
ncbi:putative tricarboxylic transport membrane protein [Paucibacter oligotrophus]|uniref:Putative tricarboxylic transport membrane protein n=1 Tax=Roseateles oligotrophus TaxID=1769250 RepID=A0A840L7D0_9BURK|nr:tripartite tricarboxylate transporter TctB family protein [Roseateles oligotrophus]MBB4842059.1 putative tricarboxylic transport membrane protein [Roseateles oligotrophus]